VPSGIPEFRYTRERNADPETNFGREQELIKFYFSETTDRYLMIAIFSHFNEFAIATQRPSKSNTVANEEDCHTWTEYLHYPQYFMVNGNCVLPNKPLSFFADIEGNYVSPSDKPLPSRATKISVELISVTKEWFEYNKIENKQPDGLDHLVLPPQKAYTNIKNGYGLIYGSNGIKTDLF
jgi:hypothetical protein